MHKTQTALASAIALSLLLSGCSSMNRINQTMAQSDSDYGTAKGHLGQLSSGSPVQDLTSQWINPVPLNSPSQTQAQLPGCALTLTRPGDVSLAEISAFITRTCKLPVVVTPDAQAAMTTGQGKTEKIQGSVPAPDASGMVPLNAIGGGAPVTRDAGSMGNTLRGVYWQGSLSGLLDNVTTRLGLSWRYEQGRISIFYVNTKTFPVMFMDSKTAFSSKVVSGTTTSSGTSGGSSGGGMSGDVNTSQTTTMEMTSGLYNDLQNTIKAMLTPGVGRLFLAAGMLTVTDTPRVLDAVGHYIDDRNMELNRQVVLNVKVFSVEKRRQDQLGIDWNAVFTSGSVGGSLTSAFTREGSGESLLDYIERCLSDALRTYKMLAGRTVFELNPDTRVIAIDLNNAVGGKTRAGQVKTGLMYLYAGQLAAGHFELPQYRNELMGHLPEMYRSFHHERLTQLAQEVKTKIYDELHNAKDIPFIMSKLVTQDLENRKFFIRTVLSSQYLNHFPHEILKSANSLYLMQVSHEDLPLLTEHFGVPMHTAQAFRHIGSGASPDGSGTHFLACFRLKTGRVVQILKNTLGPKELWALNSTPKDAALRDQLYDLLDGRTARAILAEAFPTGSAIKLIDLRQKEAKETDHGNVINRLASELIPARGLQI